MLQMCERNAAFRVTPRRIFTALRPARMCGKFRRTRQEARSQFFTSFWSTLCHLLRERVWKIYLFIGEEENKSSDGEEEPESGVGDKHPRTKWGSRKMLSLENVQITQIKTSFSLDAPENFSLQKLKGKQETFPSFFLFQFFQQMNHFSPNIFSNLFEALQHDCSLRVFSLKFNKTRTFLGWVKSWSWLGLIALLCRSLYWGTFAVFRIIHLIPTQPITVSCKDFSILHSAEYFCNSRINLNKYYISDLIFCFSFICNNPRPKHSYTPP